MADRLGMEQESKQSNLLVTLKAPDLHSAFSNDNYK